ncbi:MAG: hypothetical protein WBH47_14040 [Streptosporangiaceae bacterium]
MQNGTKPDATPRVRAMIADAADPFAGIPNDDARYTGTELETSAEREARQNRATP